MRALAEGRGIPLSHLPDRAGVSRSHFSDVLAGRKSLTLKWLAGIAEVLSVDAGQLVCPHRDEEVR